ncbi:MAG: valine--pyruvate transaminase [Treponema sp.]|nr:valine--pyruvate transaminase [Treponema sp.]
MELSDFGQKLSGPSGINQLMDDLGKPFPDGLRIVQMGGGNPARIPEIENMYRNRMEKILANGEDFENLIGRYDAPQGKTSFLENVAEYFSNKYGWKITSENIAVANGSQSAFFYLFNMFAGTCTKKDGTTIKKKIVFPLVPEYVGYADQCIEKDIFVGIPASFEFFDDNTFKYHIDFDSLEKYLSCHKNDTSGLCVTRPTNPTGNVLTDDEIKRLSALSKKYNIPLFIDNAYGLPWPDIIFTEDAEPYWDENVILSMSLSKIGLPSLRTGIIIARKEIISCISKINAIAALASGSLGQALGGELIRSGKLIDAASKYVRPFYEKKSQNIQRLIHKYFSGTEYKMHKSEGSIFVWLYLPDLKISTIEFYNILKEKGVFVMPGEYFFFGNSPDSTPVQNHPHFNKCLRLNYAGNEDDVEYGIKLIAEEYKKLCA